MTRNHPCNLLIALATLLFTSCAEAPEPETQPQETPDAQYDASAYDSHEDGALKYYLMAQDALAHDRFEPAHRAVAQLSEHLAESQQPLVRAAVDAADIKSLRAAFKPLSDALLDLPLPDGYRRAHCSMAFDYSGASWIQADGEIMNPYYGSGMLHCGLFEEPAEQPSEGSD